MTDKQRAKKLIEPIEVVCGMLDDLKKACKDAHEIIIKDVVEKGSKTSLVHTDGANVQAYWYALTDFVAFAEALLEVTKYLEKTGHLQECKRGLDQIELSMKKFKDFNNNNNPQS